MKQAESTRKIASGETERVERGEPKLYAARRKVGVWMRGEMQRARVFGKHSAEETAAGAQGNIAQAH
jgi:hypothetical protein